MQIGNRTACLHCLCAMLPLPAWALLGGPWRVALVSTRLYHLCLLLCCRVDMSLHCACFYTGCAPCSLQCFFQVPSFTKIFFHLLGRGKWALLFLKRCILQSNCCLLGRKQPLQHLKSLNSLLSCYVRVTIIQN